MRKRLPILFLLTALLLTGCIARPVPRPDREDTPYEQDVPGVEADIAEISEYGNLVLTIAPDAMTESGYEPGDIVDVRIGDAKIRMPIGSNYSDVDAGEPVCCFRTNSKGAGEVVLAVHSGDLASFTGIAEKQTTDDAPGYEWIYADGHDEDVTVYIAMAEKQGYAAEYAMHQAGKTRTNDRGDYADLNDAEYANFRAVETNGMGKGTLFRSSSPINPVMNRSREADAALLDSRVNTVMNMSDSEELMKEYPEYSRTGYSGCNIIALEMSTDIFTEEFEGRLADGFRFLADHDGPYLIHCLEGKDRTGFACAVLECLMGADAEEAVEDYMLSYYNYYYTAPGTEEYDSIAAENIEADLARAFGIRSIRDPGTDLQACAQDYLGRIGMSAGEVSALKDNLSKDRSIM